MLEAPRITYYARVLDNLTGKELLPFKNAMDNETWYFGKCNSKEGGESEYIIEFDIWNNELSFNAGTYDTKCQDASNFKFYVYPNNNNTKDIVSYIYARSLTDGYNDFINISYPNYIEVIGNANPIEKKLKGNGDHAIIQTKLILPKNCNLVDQRYSFNFSLSYDCE